MEKDSGVTVTLQELQFGTSLTNTDAYMSISPDYKQLQHFLLSVSMMYQLTISVSPLVQGVPRHTDLHTGVCVKRVWNIFEDLSRHVHRCLHALYLPSILLTHPWLTRSWREMSQGRTPWWASSTIRCRTTSGRGLPFTNTPPSWFTPPCPTRERNESR